MAVTKATGVHKIHSTFSVSGGVLSFYRDNASTQFAFGESGTGLDVKFFGDTASAFILWDESADTLVGASSARLNWLGTVTVSGATTFSGTVDFTGSAVTVGNASTDKLGFFGATAVVQQAFVASSGVGSTQAMAIVNALVNLGLMASA